MLRDRHTDLQALTERDAIELLRSQTIGRLAFLDGHHPLVLPVTFGLVDDMPVFRTGAGAKLRAARGRPASFEVDEIHPMTRAGWSVVVRGHLEEVTAADRALLQAIEEAVEPWASHDAEHALRLRPWSITGRRLVPPVRRPR